MLKHAVQNSGKFEIRRRLRQNFSNKRRVYLFFLQAVTMSKRQNRPGPVIHNKKNK